MTGYEAVIGLEVHAQLKTATKAFCSCPATYGASPNTVTCPVCLGHPGTLPVVNRNLIRYAIVTGVATNCNIRTYTTFSRKNYFYPDLPKGYQISQFEDPICYGGYIEIEEEGAARRIGITRIHMEEDSGKLIHDLDVDTLIDLNRAGIPLIEIVSEPDLRKAREAYLYLKELRQILVYLDICDGNLEEGSLRCDANVSVRPVGREAFGVKTEVKNLNSFRNVEKAIEYEIQRQIEVITSGGTIAQETRLWDAGAQQTRVMRTKEQSHDYRYFPEPDLPSLQIEPEYIAEVQKALPELAHARRKRLVLQYGLPRYDADILVSERTLADYFERTCAAIGNPTTSAYKSVSNWILTELMRVTGQRKINIEQLELSPERLAGLVNAVESGVISNKIAKEIFPEILETGQTADEIIHKNGLKQVSDEQEIDKLIKVVIASNSDNVHKYRSGKSNLLGYFVGQVLKASGGAANPGLVTERMREMLETEHL